MTVITMPTTEKKSDNVPLVTNIEIDPSAQVSHCRRRNCGLGFFSRHNSPRSRIRIRKYRQWFFTLSPSRLYRFLL